jgi:hypothetical protein
MASTTAGTVPPFGPLPGMTPSGRNSAGVAAFGAVPWPQTMETLPAARLEQRDRGLAAQSEVRDLAGGGGEYRGGARIEGVATGLEQADAGFHRELPSGRHHAVRAVELRLQRAAKLGSLRHRWRGAGGGR